MNELPSDVLKLITLESSPGCMASVCKAMDIYDDKWYYDYLIMRYDRSEIVGRAFSFRELCRRSLLEGNLYKLRVHDDKQKDLKINAIHAIPARINYALSNKNYVLKFNGDLYMVDYDLNQKIIDCDVINIDYECYIKQTKLYIHNGLRCDTIDLPNIDSKILKIQKIGYIEFNIMCHFYTSNTIYFTHYDTLEKYQIHSNHIKYNIIRAYTKAIVIPKYLGYIYIE